MRFTLPSLFSALPRLVLGSARCALCQADCPGKISLCADCRSGLPWLEQSCGQCALPLDSSLDGGRLLCGRCLRDTVPLDSTFAPLIYRDEAKRCLLRFKLSGDLVAGKVLGDLLALHLLHCLNDRHHTAEGLHLVPIPLHLRRLRQRGFNQSAELCRPVSALLKLPVSANLLQRRHHTEPFRSLTASQRKQYARSLFAVRTTPPPAVLLIDDVMTTGTTLFSAAASLKAAGCRRVFAAAVARTP